MQRGQGMKRYVGGGNCASDAPTQTHNTLHIAGHTRVHVLVSLKSAAVGLRWGLGRDTHALFHSCIIRQVIIQISVHPKRDNDHETVFGAQIQEITVLLVQVPGVDSDGIEGLADFLKGWGAHCPLACLQLPALLRNDASQATCMPPRRVEEMPPRRVEETGAATRPTAKQGSNAPPETVERSEKGASKAKKQITQCGPPLWPCSVASQGGDSRMAHVHNPQAVFRFFLSSEGKLETWGESLQFFV